MRPAVWQLIDEATQQLVGEMAYADIKKHVWAKHPDVNSSTLTCQIIICTVNHPSRIHYPENKKPRICNSQYDFLYHTGRGRVVRYDPSQHGEWEIADKNGALLVRMSQEATDESDQASGSTCEDQGGIFALESHLRDYLAKNLPTLDEGKTSLNLYVSPDGRDGVEFQTEVGPTDILAVSQAGDFYVFELKLGRGPDAALGQILRYMGWVQQHLANGKNVYGVVIAADVSTKLKYAVTQVPSVRLMEYDLKVTLRTAEL